MYEWIKALHIIAIIAWMAGSLYLPRLFVYHAESEKGSRQSETFKIMERRLLRFIMTPAMLVSWGAGVYLMMTGGWMSQGWMHGKLALVLILSGFHGWCAVQVKKFAQDKNVHDSRYFRFANEVPTVLMIGIVIFVVVKPF